MAEPQNKSKTSTSKSTSTKSEKTSKAAGNKSNKKLWGIIAGIIGGLVVLGLIIFAICKMGGGSEQWSDTSDFKFRVKVAAGLDKVSREDAEKYFDLDQDEPFVAYLDKDQNVGVALTQTDTDIENDDMQQYLDLMKTALGSSLISSELYEVDGHKVASIKMEVKSGSSKDYSHMIFFPDDNKKLSMVNFVCMEDKRDEWESKGDKIIKSLEFVK